MTNWIVRVIFCWNWKSSYFNYCLLILQCTKHFCCFVGAQCTVWYSRLTIRWTALAFVCTCGVSASPGRSLQVIAYFIYSTAQSVASAFLMSLNTKEMAYVKPLWTNQSIFHASNMLFHFMHKIHTLIQKEI